MLILFHAEDFKTIFAHAAASCDFYSQHARNVERIRPLHLRFAENRNPVRFECFHFQPEF